MSRPKTVKNGMTSGSLRPRRRSGTFLAAYDLGLNILMVRYNARYVSRFPGDPRAKSGCGLNNCFDWIHEALCRLAQHFPEHRLTDLVQKASQLRASLFHSRLDSHGVRSGMTDDFMTSEERKLLFELLKQSADASRHVPHLLAWFRLGKAMGLCFNNLLFEDRELVLRSFGTLVRSAKLLPKRQIDRTKVLSRLTAVPRVRAIDEPNRLLNSVLREKQDAFDTAMPTVAVIRKVEKLERSLRRELASVHDLHRVRFLVDPPRPIVELDGVRFPVSYHQFQIVRQIVRARGKYVTGYKMVQNQPSLESANIGREVQRLPEAVGSLIERRKGHEGGFRWLG
jgi:hypothetical protein